MGDSLPRTTFECSHLKTSLVHTSVHTVRIPFVTGPKSENFSADRPAETARSQRKISVKRVSPYDWTILTKPGDLHVETSDPAPQRGSIAVTIEPVAMDQAECDMMDPISNRD